jgi:hypothetical protein
MPEYEIKCWDNESLKGIDNTFVKEAFVARKWAFVADYIRMYALYTYGGIYLDSDIEVYKSFDSFLDNSFFSGTDISPTQYIQGPESGIIGAERHHPFLEELLKYYDNRHFINESGELDILILPRIMGGILNKYGYKYEDRIQILPFNSRIYSSSYFCNVNSIKYRKRNYAYHINTNTWVCNYSERGILAKFCWKHNLMKIYKKIEYIRMYLTNKFKKI